jgi:dynactin complex subunit
MSKERLTSTKGLIDLYAMRVRFTTNEKRIKELLVEFGNEFAAQEVEAAIAETKKQRDELLEALKNITDPIGYMRSKLKDGEQLNGHYAIQLANDAQYLRGIAEAAITNAQEK